MANLRILFVPWDRFPPFRPAARVIFFSELPKRGHRIDWLIQADDRPEARSDESKDRDRYTGGRVFVGKTHYRRSFLGRVRKHFLNLKHSFRIFSLARENDYDLIQAKDNFIAAIFGILAARRNRIPFFYWMAYPRAEANILEGRSGVARYPLLYILRGYTLKFLVYRCILPYSDHVFVQSEQMKRDIEKHGVDPARMTPVPSSVDLAEIPADCPGDVKPRIDKASDKWVVYVGTLKRVRRLDFIIRSFALVRDQCADARLIIIGAGDDESDLEMLREEARNLGVDEFVRFTGFLDMVEAWEFVRQSDVCLSPYYPTEILRSTSPTKLVEYMAMSKPVVGNDHPEQTLVMNSSRGGITTPWDERLFADAVVQILRDPEKAKEMGRLGREFVEAHRTNSEMGALVERTYLRVCGERQIEAG